MHGFWLLLFLTKLCSHTDTFKLDTETRHRNIKVCSVCYIMYVKIVKQLHK